MNRDHSTHFQRVRRACSPEWTAYMTEKYNHPPNLTYYEMPITMDREYNVVYDEADIAEAAE